MAKQVPPPPKKKTETIRKRHFYSILCEEGTDSSNIEQLSFNTRTVDGNLDTHEDFLGFYEVHYRSLWKIIRKITIGQNFMRQSMLLFKPL